MDRRAGSYVLILELTAPVELTAGALGVLCFVQGWYAYVGSAFGPGGIAARCRHHIARTARPHWHIDYLRAVCELREIWCSADPQRREHQWADLLGRCRGGRRPHPGFGASDCGCASHLFLFPHRPSLAGFKRRAYGELAAQQPVQRIVPPFAG